MNTLTDLEFAAWDASAALSRFLEIIPHHPHYAPAEAKDLLTVIDRVRPLLVKVADSSKAVA